MLVLRDRSRECTPSAGGSPTLQAGRLRSGCCHPTWHRLRVASMVCVAGTQETKVQGDWLWRADAHKWCPDCDVSEEDWLHVGPGAGGLRADVGELMLLGPRVCWLRLSQGAHGPPSASSPATQPSHPCLESTTGCIDMNSVGPGESALRGSACSNIEVPGACCIEGLRALPISDCSTQSCTDAPRTAGTCGSPRQRCMDRCSEDSRYRHNEWYEGGARGHVVVCQHTNPLRHTGAEQTGAIMCVHSCTPFNSLNCSVCCSLAHLRPWLGQAWLCRKHRQCGGGRVKKI